MSARVVVVALALVALVAVALVAVLVLVAFVVVVVVVVLAPLAFWRPTLHFEPGDSRCSRGWRLEGKAFSRHLADELPIP